MLREGRLEATLKSGTVMDTDTVVVFDVGPLVPLTMTE